MTLYRHNVAIGAYAVDVNLVTAGRLQITGFSNGDQLSLRHPNSDQLKWGFYVNMLDSSLNFYNNGIWRATIDRVTGVYTALSDRRLKKNIQPMANVINAVMQLPTYSFNYLNSEENDRRVLGLMAQEVQQFFPELVYQRYDRTIDKPMLTMDYSGLSVVALKAIQEQQATIQQQQAQINRQQQAIDLLMTKIEALEKKQLTPFNFLGYL